MWPKRDAYRYDLPRAQRLGAIVTMHRLKWGRKSRIQITVRCALPSLTDHVSGKAERAFKRHLRACAVFADPGEPEWITAAANLKV
jgi:hypothetical protein